MNKNDELQELPECDVKILDFVQSCGKADIETISKKLPCVESVPLRVKRLSVQQYSQPDALSHRRPLPNTSYLLGDGRTPEMYQLTDLGKIVVQDNKYRRRRERRLLWVNGMWLPFLVSLITALALATLRSLLSMM